MSTKGGFDGEDRVSATQIEVAFRTAPPPPTENNNVSPLSATSSRRAKNSQHSLTELFIDDLTLRKGEDSSRAKPPKPEGIPPLTPEPVGEGHSSNSSGSTYSNSSPSTDSNFNRGGASSSSLSVSSRSGSSRSLVSTPIPSPTAVSPAPPAPTFTSNHAAAAAPSSSPFAVGSPLPSPVASSTTSHITSTTYTTNNSTPPSIIHAVTTTTNSAASPLGSVTTGSSTAFISSTSSSSNPSSHSSGSNSHATVLSTSSSTFTSTASTTSTTASSSPTSSTATVVTATISPSSAHRRELTAIALPENLLPDDFFDDDSVGRGRLKRPSWQAPPKPVNFPAESDKIAEKQPPPPQHHHPRQSSASHLLPPQPSLQQPAPPPSLSPQQSPRQQQQQQQQQQPQQTNTSQHQSQQHQQQQQQQQQHYPPPPLQPSNSQQQIQDNDKIPPPPDIPPPPLPTHHVQKRQSIIERLMGPSEKKAIEKAVTSAKADNPLSSKPSTNEKQISGKVDLESEEGPLEDDGVLSFVHFPHIFDAILAQVNGGLHVVKRTVSYLKKLITIQEQFVLESEKVSHLELSKQDTLKKEDQMLGFLELAVSVRANMESMIKRHKHFGIQLSSCVIKPLELFIKDSDVSCTKLVQGYERAALTVAQHTAEMEKQRQACLKEWDELGEALAVEKSKPQGVPKKKLQTKKAFLRFEELKAMAMPARHQFVHVTRPHLLRKFQALEIARMEILQLTMTEFAKAQAAFWGTEITQPQLISGIQDSGSLSAAAVLHDTMLRWLRQHGSAPATQLSPSQLPCTPEALDTEAWREFMILPQPGEDDEEEEEITPSHARAGTGLASMLRGVVSKKKKRFQEGGFDLDLSYITPRIIAMGFPAESLTGLYRNNMVDVQKFMTTRHPGRVHVYNLCAELHYDPQKFDGQVSCFPFFDHNPCPLNMILPFCLHVHEWLTKDTNNVVAVHCKAGKGRTGFMIACYLLYAGTCATAPEALEFYANKRTKDAKGVTIPSQIRYVSYFEELLGSIGWMERVGPSIPVRNILFLKSVTLRGIPYAYSACPEQLSFVVVDPNKKHEDGTYKTVFSSKGVLQPHADLAQDCVLFSAGTAPCIMELCDDFKVVFSGSSKLFSLWANTRVVHEEVPLSFHPPYKPPVGMHSSEDPFRVAPKDHRPARIIVCPSCGHERPHELVGNSDEPRPITEEDVSELCSACKKSYVESESFSPQGSLKGGETDESNSSSSSTSNSGKGGGNSEETDKVIEDRMRAEKTKDWKEVARRLQREAEQAAKVNNAYRLVMGKKDLDKAVKDKKHLLFPAYMTVEFLFHEVYRLESDGKATAIRVPSSSSTSTTQTSASITPHISSSSALTSISTQPTISHSTSSSCSLSSSASAMNLTRINPSSSSSQSGIARAASSLSIVSSSSSKPPTPSPSPAQKALASSASSFTLSG